MGFHPYDDRPNRIEGVPAEEGIAEGDAFDRIGLDPEAQRNFTDDPGPRDAHTDAEDPEDAEDDADAGRETGPERERSIELDAPELDEA